MSDRSGLWFQSVFQARSTIQVCLHPELNICTLVMNHGVPCPVCQNMGVETVRLRFAQPLDLDELARMFSELWPDSPIQEHRAELVRLLSGDTPGAMPLAILVAVVDDHSLAGFVEVDLRSHADGCDPAIPAGYVEGWYVSAAYRRTGVGARLLAAAEDWARAHGCIEMASDTWLENNVSQKAHEKLGYEPVDRCVHYRKKL